MANKNPRKVFHFHLWVASFLHVPTLIIFSFIFDLEAVSNSLEESTDSCFQKGQCRDSVHIASEVLSDEYACLDFCKVTDGCTW